MFKSRTFFRIELPWTSSVGIRVFKTQFRGKKYEEVRRVYNKGVKSSKKRKLASYRRINKTGTSQVGAISKAQKAQNIFIAKNLKFSKKNFLSENVAQCQKM